MSKNPYHMLIKSIYLLLISVGILLINYISASGNSATTIYIIFHYLGVILFFVGVCVGIAGFFAYDEEGKHQ